MKLNWGERFVVNNPLRVLEQRLEINKLKQMMPLKPGFVALEIGCGRGAGAGLILEAFKPSLVYAMDLDEEMLIKAKHYLPSEKRQQIRLFAADTACLPVKSASLDAVFGFGVLHHVIDWRSALTEIARALKPEGVYFLEELYPTLYQNFITRHILLHPTKDRFSGPELRQSLADVKLPLKDFREVARIGLLGVAVKEI